MVFSFVGRGRRKRKRARSRALLWCLKSGGCYAFEASIHQLMRFSAHRLRPTIDELVAAGMPANQAATISRLDGNALTYVLDGPAFEDWDIDTLLRRMECPVLLEHGERGVGAGVAASAIYEGELDRAVPLIKDCTVVQIKGSGHIPMVQQPEEFMRVASGFVQRIVSGT